MPPVADAGQAEAHQCESGGFRHRGCRVDRHGDIVEPPGFVPQSLQIRVEEGQVQGRSGMREGEATRVVTEKAVYLPPVVDAVEVPCGGGCNGVRLGAGQRVEVGEGPGLTVAIHREPDGIRTNGGSVAIPAVHDVEIEVDGGRSVTGQPGQGDGQTTVGVITESAAGTIDHRGRSAGERRQQKNSHPTISKYLQFHVVSYSISRGHQACGLVYRSFVSIPLLYDTRCMPALISDLNSTSRSLIPHFSDGNCQKG